MGLLINKIGDPYFDAMDEEMALAFSIYCGVCIMHSVVYHKIEEAHIRNTLANELVMYHMKVSRTVRPFRNSTANVTDLQTLITPFESHSADYGKNIARRFSTELNSNGGNRYKIIDIAYRISKLLD